MHRKILITSLLAALAGAASAQDVRREDRRQDANQREVEVQLPLPRNADGTLDRAALEREIRARFAGGATEIQFRERGLTEAEARRLLLADRSLLADIARILPNDGVERHVRFRGAVDARVQRNEDGELRARIEDINIGNLSAAQRADLARRLAAQSGFERVRIRGTDANGERVRVEFRDDRGIVKNEGRGGRVDRADRNDRKDGNDRHDRADRNDRHDHADRNGRHDRADRNDRGGRHERAERAERPERMARFERPERPERVERSERPERVERPDRPDRSGRH